MSGCKRFPGSPSAGEAKRIRGGGFEDGYEPQPEDVSGRF